MAFDHCVFAGHLCHFTNGSLNSSDHLSDSVRLLPEGRLFRFFARAPTRNGTIIRVDRHQGDIRQFPIRGGVRFGRLTQAGVVSVMVGEDVPFEGAFRFIVGVSCSLAWERVVVGLSAVAKGMFLLSRCTAFARAGYRSQASGDHVDGGEHASMQFVGVISRHEVKRTTQVVGLHAITFLVMGFVERVEGNHSRVRVRLAIRAFLRGLRVRRPRRAAARAGTRYH